MAYYDNVPFTDNKGNTIYPQTKENSIYDDNNVKLKDKLVTMQNQIDSIHNATNIATSDLNGLMSKEDYNTLQHLNKEITNKQYSDVIVTNNSVEKIPDNAVCGAMKEISIKGVTAQNIVKDGNFSHGVTYWNTACSTVSVTENVIKITGTGSSSGPNTCQKHDYYAGHIYYGMGDIRVLNSDATCIKMRFASGYGDIDLNAPIVNTWYHLSRRYICSVNITGGYCYMGAFYPDAATSNGKSHEARNIMAIDLTVAFGAGNEPDEATCDKIFNKWFDGIQSTCIKEIKSTGKNFFNINGDINNTGSDVRRVLNNLSYPNKVVNNRTLEIGNWSSGYHGLGQIIKVKPNTTYWFGAHAPKTNKCAMYLIIHSVNDVNRKQLIIQIGATSRTSYTTSSNENAIFFSLDVGANLYTAGQMLQDIWFSDEDILSNYEPYYEDVLYINHSLHSIPNGKKDEITPQGYLYQRTKEYTLQASDIYKIITSTTNLDLVCVNKDAISNFVNYASEDLIATSIFAESFVPRCNAAFDTVELIGKFYYNPTDGLTFAVPKGEYVNLAAAQTALTGTKIIYELITPIIKDKVTKGSLTSRASGHIVIEHEGPAPELSYSYPMNTQAVISGNKQMCINNSIDILNHENRISNIYLDNDKRPAFTDLTVGSRKFGSVVGFNSVVQGSDNEASGLYSHASGVMTIAEGQNQFVVGRYNNPNASDLFQVGNGTSNAARNNAMRVTADGDIINGYGDSLHGMKNNSVYEPLTINPYTGITILSGGISKNSLGDVRINLTLKGVVLAAAGGKNIATVNASFSGGAPISFSGTISVNGSNHFAICTLNILNTTVFILSTVAINTDHILCFRNYL
jgi:hypothetical protein